MGPRPQDKDYNPQIPGRIERDLRGDEQRVIQEKEAEKDKPPAIPAPSPAEKQDKSYD